MVFERLPKITKIAGGTKTLISPGITLDTYGAASFLFGNTEGDTLTVKVKVEKEDGTEEFVPFLFKESDAEEFEGMDAEGKSVTGGGTFVAAVTADSLGSRDFDRVSVSLECSENLSAVYALLTQPRYGE